MSDPSASYRCRTCAREWVAAPGYAVCPGWVEEVHAAIAASALRLGAVIDSWEAVGEQLGVEPHHYYVTWIDYRDRGAA